MRTVYATRFSVVDQDEANRTLDYAKAWIEGWYRRKRINISLPSFLSKGEAALNPIRGHKLNISVFTSEKQADCSLADISWEYPDDYDKALGWIIKLSLLRSSKELLLSLELAITGLIFQIKPTYIRLGPPRLIRDVTALRSVVFGGQSYESSSDLIAAEEVESLCATILDPERSIPVIVVSREVHSDSPLVDVEELAQGLAGLAKVYELERVMNFPLGEARSFPICRR